MWSDSPVGGSTKVTGYIRHDENLLHEICIKKSAQQQHHIPRDETRCLVDGLEILKPPNNSLTSEPHREYGLIIHSLVGLVVLLPFHLNEQKKVHVFPQLPAQE